MDQKSYFKITEPTLEQEVAAYFAKNLGGKVATQGSPEGGGGFDVLVVLPKTSLVIELEIGTKRKLVEGIIQANDYKERLGAGGIIALVYPEHIRKRVTTNDVKELSLGVPVNGLILSPFLNKAFDEVTVPQILDVLRENIGRVKPVVAVDLVVRTLRQCVEMLSYRLKQEKGVIAPALQTVVQSFDLFKVLAEIDQVKNSEKLRIISSDLAAYVLVNQMLLYHILSHALKLPSITQFVHIGQLTKLFERIMDIDYRAVYAVDVASKLPGATLKEVNITAIAIKSIQPEHLQHDLLGRVFHEFLPQETRKLLGAFYTKPVAAELLAWLSVDREDEKVIDPACGSGTLLVAAYRRKKNLNLSRSHRTLIEKDIVGVDIMPFAAHLTALNLTLQDPTEPTDKIFVGIGNSLSMSPKTPLVTLQQTQRLFDLSTKPEKVDINQERNGEGKRLVNLPESVNTVIMNPPFTRKERLTQEMFGDLKPAFVKVQNYWAYFVVFADALLSKEGKVAAVLPRDFVTGSQSAELREKLLESGRYTIRYIVRSVNEMAFSEGAFFRDFLIVLEKGGSEDKPAGIVYLKPRISELTIEQSHQIAEKVRNTISTFYEDDFIAIDWIPQSEIKKHWKNLWRFVGFASPQNAHLFQELNDTMDSSKILVSLKDHPSVKSNIIRGIEPRSEGMLNSVFIVTPPLERFERALMILTKQTSSSLSIALHSTRSPSTYTAEIPLREVLPAAKTHIYLKSWDLNNIHDWILTKIPSGISEEMKTILKLDEVDFNDLLSQGKTRASNLLIARRINLAANGTTAIGFFSKDKVMPGKAFWSVITQDINEAKFLCAFINSVFGISQILLKRTETGGSWSEITKEHLETFRVPVFSKIAKEQQKEFLKLFEQIKNNYELPPLMEQFSANDGLRVEIDKYFRKLLQPSLDISKTYNAIRNELQQMKIAMSSSRAAEETSPEQINLLD